MIKNLINADTKPKVFAIGTHSLIGIWKKIIMNGIFTPAPPIPPAVPIIVNDDSRNTPMKLSIDGGHSIGVNRIV